MTSTIDALAKSIKLTFHQQVSIINFMFSLNPSVLLTQKELPLCNNMPYLEKSTVYLLFNKSSNPTIHITRKWDVFLPSKNNVWIFG